MGLQHKLTFDDIELGQMAFGNSVGEYSCPEFVTALLTHLLNEIGMAFWNKNQEEWDTNDDPEIPGIVFNPYYWGDDPQEAGKPNFKFEDVEIRWYKHPGRSMTVNKSLTEKQWRVWFDKCLKRIQSYDSHAS